MVALPPTPSADAQELLRLRLVRHILPFIELGEEAGVDVEGLLAHVGLSRRALRNPKTELPYYQIHWLLEQLAAQSGDPEIGLRAAERTSFVRTDFLGNLIKHLVHTSSDLLTVLQFLAHFGTYVARTTKVHMRVCDPLVITTITPAVAGTPELNDWWAGAVCALTQTLGGEGLHPLEVRLPRPCPSSPERYEKFFGSRVVFDAPRLELVYELEAVRSRKIQDLPQPAPFPATLTARAGNALALQIRKHVLARLADGVPLLPTVAKTLGLSARTLRRRLSEVRSSYAELVDEARRERALSLASRPHLDVGRLAELTGFTDASAFARAFRRWTGQRPREYMQRARERARH